MEGCDAGLRAVSWYPDCNAFRFDKTRWQLKEAEVISTSFEYIFSYSIFESPSKKDKILFG